MSSRTSSLRFRHEVLAAGACVFALACPVGALAAGGTARICSYECTFCASCADTMAGVCPNCGGELVRRPKRQR